MAAEADTAAAAAIASAGALAIGMFIFAVTLTEPVYYCCDICPTCYNAASENSSIDPQAGDYSQICTLDLDHADEHVCPEQHTWAGSPVGFNSRQRAMQH